MRRKLFATMALALLAFAACVSTAGAATPDARLRTDRRIGVSGGVIVAEGEVVNGPVVSIDGSVVVDGTVDDDVLVGNGRVDINGQVTGDVFVVHGNVVVSGLVGGDIVVLDGRITTRDGAQVNGDVTSRRAPDVASGTVRGDVKTLNVGNLFAGFVVAFLILLWISVTASLALLGLLFVLVFPRAADATAAAGRRFWPTLGWGALVGIGGPVVGVLLLFTLIGIPLGLGISSAFSLLAPLGYVASSLILGRRMVKGTSTGARIGAFFAGFGILRAVALLPGIGFIVWFLVCLYGLGALTQAAWRAGRLPRDEQTVEPEPEPGPESESEPGPERQDAPGSP